MAKLINAISFLVPLEFFIYKNINLQSITKSSTVICMTRNSSCYNIKNKHWGTEEQSEYKVCILVIINKQYHRIQRHKLNSSTKPREQDIQDSEDTL